MPSRHSPAVSGSRTITAPVRNLDETEFVVAQKNVRQGASSFVDQGSKGCVPFGQTTLQAAFTHCHLVCDVGQIRPARLQQTHDDVSGADHHIEPGIQRGPCVKADLRHDFVDTFIGVGKFAVKVFARKDAAIVPRTEVDHGAESRVERREIALWFGALQVHEDGFPFLSGEVSDVADEYGSSHVREGRKTSHCRRIGPFVDDEVAFLTNTVVGRVYNQLGDAGKKGPHGPQVRRVEHGEAERTCISEPVGICIFEGECRILGFMRKKFKEVAKAVKADPGSRVPESRRIKAADVKKS